MARVVPIGRDRSLTIGEADDPIRIPGHERPCVGRARLSGADRVGMKYANEPSLVFLRFVASGDPILSVERESILGGSRCVTNDRIAFDRYRMFLLQATVDDAAALQRQPVAASGDHAILDFYRKLRDNRIRHTRLNPPYPIHTVSMRHPGGDGNGGATGYCTCLPGFTRKKTSPSAISDRMDTVMNTVRCEMLIIQPNSGGPTATPKKRRLL